jgi:hypothetical protein
MMVPVTAIIKEHPLRFEPPQSDLAQGLAIFLFSGLPGHKVHRGPLPRSANGFSGKRLPLRLRDFGLGQFRTHPGTDAKTNAAAQFLGTIGMFEPVEQFVFMAGGISPKIAFPRIIRQRGKGQFGAGRRRLLRRHMAVPELIGQHQVCFGPHGHHRLITPGRPHNTGERLLCGSQ